MKRFQDIELGVSSNLLICGSPGQVLCEQLVRPSKMLPVIKQFCLGVTFSPRLCLQSNWFIFKLHIFLHIKSNSLHYFI